MTSADPTRNHLTNLGHELPAAPLVDVRDMIVVHTALLREFRLAPAAVSRTAPGDNRRATAVAAHVRLLCDLLHHHHASEDALLWPKLRERTSPNALDVIEEAEAQHHALDAALTRVGILREAWADDPVGVRRDQLADQLEILHALLREHLDLEERALLPIAAMVMTEGEWQAIGEAGMAAVPKAAMPLAFGMFAYEGDPTVLAEMLRPAPPIARTLLPFIGPRVYARRARLIHGSARP